MLRFQRVSRISRRPSANALRCRGIPRAFTRVVIGFPSPPSPPPPHLLAGLALDAGGWAADGLTPHGHVMAGIVFALKVLYEEIGGEAQSSAQLRPLLAGLSLQLDLLCQRDSRLAFLFSGYAF